MRTRKKSEENTSRAVANVVAQMKGLKSLSPPPANTIHSESRNEKPVASAAQDAIPVQRQVYVGGKKLTKKQKKNLAGVKKDEIKAWDADPGKTIGFKDAAELNDFSNEKTDNIGYVKKEKAWIRLHEQGLKVIGEDHTATTLMDIIEATGNEKFIYESYSNIPGNAPKKLKTLYAQARKKNEDTYHVRHTPENKEYENHEAEIFFPKVAFLLDKILTAARTGCIEGYLHEVLRGILPVILQAEDAFRYSDLGKAYAANASWIKTLQTELDALEVERQKFVAERKAEKESEGSKPPDPYKPDSEIKTAFFAQGYKIFALIKANHKSFKKLAKVIGNRALEKGEKEREKLPPEDRKKFTIKPGEDAFGEKEKPDHKHFNTAREVAMFRRLLKASGSGYLLGGVGDKHRESLAGHLAEKGIESYEMKDYIKLSAETGKLGVGEDVKEEATKEETGITEDSKKVKKKRERAHEAATIIEQDPDEEADSGEDLKSKKKKNVEEEQEKTDLEKNGQEGSEDLVEDIYTGEIRSKRKKNNRAKRPPGK